MPDLQDSPSRDHSVIDRSTGYLRAVGAQPEADLVRATGDDMREGGGAPRAVGTRDATPSTPRLRWLVSPAFILGAIGASVGALALGTLAYRVAHPLPTMTLIAFMGSIAGAAGGAAIIPMFKALKWTAIAAAALAVGAAALWAVHRIDPLLIRQFFPRW